MDVLGEVRGESPIKALFLDFYGTIVYEDGAVIEKITQLLYETGNAQSRREIGGFWWSEFQGMCEKAFGADFKTQRELERRSLEKTIERFGSDGNAGGLSNEMFEYWARPGIFEDSGEFLRRCPVPVYIVSNIDRQDIMRAIEYHGLKPAGVFTSEDARAYKPRRELFELALKGAGLTPGDVVHVGDSLGSDVMGASRAGIRAVFLNRSGRDVPNGVESAQSLLDLLDIF